MVCSPAAVRLLHASPPVEEAHSDDLAAGVPLEVNPSPLVYWALVVSVPYSLWPPCPSVLEHLAAVSSLQKVSLDLSAVHRPRSGQNSCNFAVTLVRVWDQESDRHVLSAW